MSDKKYGRSVKLDAKNYKISTKVRTEQDIRDELADHVEDNILNIPQHTHIRYYSAVRDLKTKAIVMESGKPKVTYKPGGFIKSKHITILPDKTITGYCMISDKPHTDHSAVAKNWSVQVEPTTVFYRIKTSKDAEIEENKKKDDEILFLKDKLKGERKKDREVEKIKVEKDDEIDKLKKQLKIFQKKLVKDKI